MTVKWAPSAVDEVIQNVNTLLATAPGTVPLSRALGTPQDVVDSPESSAAANLQADVIRAVRTYEPRVKVKKVTVTGDVQGRLTATVEVTPP